MTAARTVAQAKINLFLHVLARESTGFHTLETLFQRIELGDEVEVRVGGRGRTLDCRGAELGPVERNLAWRAAGAFAAEVGWPAGFAIEIGKRIPVGGGLGGGSADAGAVLRILNSLAPDPLPADRLLQIAVALGADVPFLASDAPRALAWGRGERLLALPALPPREVALVLPGVGVATADAFRWLAESRESRGEPRPPRARHVGIEELGDWASISALAANDFEGPVTERVPGVAALAEARGVFAPPMPAGVVPPIYRMTGSGSTWFLLLADDRVRLTLDLPEPWQVVWTRTADGVAPIERLG